MKKHVHIVILWILLLLSGYCSVVFFLPLNIPALPSSTVLLDHKGQEIGELIYSGSVRHREASSDEIPDFYKQGLVTLEDRSFWTNNGISFRGIVRSMVHDMQAGEMIEWGTTLSSGLIRNAFWIGDSRTMGKKILEFLYAIRLNRLYSKDAVLTTYINRVDYGHLNYGLKSAAKYYFDREPKDLTKAEQIALLTLPRDAKKYDPYNKPKNFRTRYESVVRILTQPHLLSQEEQNSVMNENLEWNTEHGNEFPYMADFLQTKIGTRSGKDSIHTTFDWELTRQIDTIAKNTLSELTWRNVSDYAVLIAERSTANIDPHPLLRVMIGGANYTESSAGQVNSTLALRQPGSAIKPFTYLLAFEKLGLTPESTILDLPTAYKTSENYAYEPKNYSQDYKGEISLRRALSESVNIPAVKLAEQVGVPTLLDFLQWLGMTSLQETAEHYGLWLTLGNGEVSLFELLQAYTVFANNGTYCPFRIIEGFPMDPCAVKTSSKHTDMVASILTDRYAKLGGFPLYSALDFPDRNVFVKTGTSRNFRDNWTVGFTDRYMIGVWTGNKSGEDMKGVTGATGAGEIFRRIVYALEPTEQEQPLEKQQAHTQEYLTITNPLEGSLYKKELWKSTEMQKIRLRFDTNIPYDHAFWVLDGVKVPGDFIEITPGNHTIEAILLKDGALVGKERNTFQVQ